MRMPIVRLLPYNFPEQQLGDKPWTSIQSFIDETGISGQRLRLSRALRAINKMALARTLDPESTEAPYERPILFAADTGKPFDGEFPPRSEDDTVLIDLDGLHVFIASGVLNREEEIDEAVDPPPYWTELGPATLNVATLFVNQAVQAIGSHAEPLEA